jgi:hypothetical protein
MRRGGSDAPCVWLCAMTSDQEDQSFEETVIKMCFSLLTQSTARCRDGHVEMSSTMIDSETNVSPSKSRRNSEAVSDFLTWEMNGHFQSSIFFIPSPTWTTPRFSCISETSKTSPVNDPVSFKYIAIDIAAPLATW